MPRLPKLSDIEKLVATLDRHPFGALACIVLGCLAVVALWAMLMIVK